MVYTRTKIQQNKKPFSQLGESDDDFMMGQNNHEAQAESRTKKMDKGTSSNNMNDLIEDNRPKVDMYTLEENSVSKVRIEGLVWWQRLKPESNTQYWLR